MNKIICGIDEAGRGPLAGPVTAAAVILSDDFEIPKAIYHKTQTEKNQIRLIVDSSFVLTGEISGSEHDTCLYSGQQNLVDVMKEALKNKIELLGK